MAVPVPGLDLLHYGVPPSLDLPQVGARVLVPLGTRQVTGCVIRTEERDDSEHLPTGPSPANALPPTADARDLIDVIDAEPFLPPQVVELATWLAEYYACGPGEAISTAMPPHAWIESERTAQITEAGQHALAGTLREALVHGKPVPLRMLAQRLARTQGSGAVAIHALVRALERQGLVTTSTALRGRLTAFKTTRVAAITLAGLEALSTGEAGPAELGLKQRAALEILKGVPAGVRVTALRDRGIGADAVRRLAARGLVGLREERVERDPFLAECHEEATSARDENAVLREEIAPGTGQAVSGGRVLTAEQQQAVDRLAVLAARQSFAVALVHGVTGSGKTEIYLRLARQVVDLGRSVLMMVPEIALTPAFARVFRAAFGDGVAVQHSGLSDGERHDQWHRIRRGEIQVVVGTRSAVFAPLASTGLIVVDEEHDGSYKQEESPRYHGRDVAIVRGKREGALVVLGSATPSMESYQHALSGRYEHVVLTRRVLDRPLASVSLVNMRDEFAARGPETMFSEALCAAIDERLQRQEQVLVLLNRRGFATAVFCRQCGNTLDCPNCSVSLTIHGRDTRRGRCHYCNYTALVPKTCPTCAAPFLEQVGIGTEQLEHEAKRLFAGARVARLDRDVAARRGATASLLARFGAGEIDILIGTQMIAKGHDFPRVTLVGVVSADVGLGLPDFRASERTFQLLTQVVGRAGRGERSGAAIIQTVHPEHYSVRLACTQDYPAFFEHEVQFRQAMRYPPHVSLVNAVVRGPSFQSAMEAASDLVRRVRERAAGKFGVLGPAPAALVKLRGEHRAQFFVKGIHRTAMRQAVQAAVAARPDLKRRVTIDVDPLTVL